MNWKAKTMSQSKQSEQVTSSWSNHATQILQGKTISHVEYQTSTDKLSFYWTKRAPQIVFTDGSRILPVADVELNEAGAFLVEEKKQTKVIPSL